MDISFFDFDQYALNETSSPVIQGNPEAQLAIVVNQNDFTEYNDLIDKIFKAVNIELSRQTFQIVLGDGQEISLASHLNDDIKNVFVFGVNPKCLGFNASFKAYQAYKTESYTVLFSHSLKDLSTETKFKKALWTILQTVFKT
ncbi:MAG: hypothetical protein HKN09_11970 [Saprospiraceae bacterium]|nr:hypothetical protein [Saprospiraceae bacterium]